MSDTAQDVLAHKRFVEELDSEISGLESQIAALQVVRKWHLSRVTPLTSEAPEPTVHVAEKTDRAKPKKLTGLLQFEAIQEVLKAAGRPMRPAEIVSALVDAGYKSDMDRGSLLNSTYTNMKRKPHLFEKLKDSSWQLAQGNGKLPDTAFDDI